LKGNRRITADTALRLSYYYFGNSPKFWFGNSPKFWLGLQDEYDLEEEMISKQKELETIKRF